MKIRVLTPSGVVADGEWDNAADISEKIPDRFEYYFETGEAEVLVQHGNEEPQKMFMWDLKRPIADPKLSGQSIP